MMRKFADVLASVGEFVGSDGKPAKAWTRCGVLMKDDRSGRLSLKLDVIPVRPTWSGWFAIRNVNEDPHADIEDPAGELDRVE